MHPILKMVILGVVQGATEFLPVSSSAHLTLMQDVLGIAEKRILFDVFLHLGTLIAILVVFRKDIAALFSAKRRWIFYLAVASLPAAAVGLSLHSCIERVFGSSQAVGALLIGNSLILTAGALAARRQKNLSDVDIKGALVVGAAQSLAILPGISRSGSTVCLGLMVGWERGLAVRFSFLLGIPAIVGAAAVEVAKCPTALESSGIPGMALAGMAVSAVVGYAALRIFLRAIERGKLWVFAVYCFLLGAGITVYRLAAVA